MQLDLAMVGLKRGREDTSSDEASEDSTGPSKRGWGGVGSKLVHECTLCGKAFPEPNKVTRHMRTHTGDRPYPCTTCGQAFSESGNLTTHMRTHSGDRPYPCTTCGRAFSQSSNLTRHCERVHALDQE